MPLGRTQEHVFEHHVVREQDVRRIIQNLVALVLLFLPGVAIKPDREPPAFFS